MGKKIFAALVVVVCVGFAGYNVMQSQNDKDALSDLLMANVEALADDEAPGSHNHGPTRNPLIGKKYCKNENQVNCAY